MPIDAGVAVAQPAEPAAASAADEDGDASTGCRAAAPVVKPTRTMAASATRASRAGRRAVVVREVVMASSSEGGVGENRRRRCSGSVADRWESDADAQGVDARRDNGGGDEATAGN